MLSLRYGPTLTSIHDYWKNHSFDYTDICSQSDVSAFFFLIYFLLKDNCFTEFCCFLSNLNMNQPSVQFSSVAQSCLILCDPMNRSTPGIPGIHHQLPEFTQTHVHRVSEAIQLSHSLSSLLLLPPIPPSIRVFFSESTLRMRWPKFSYTYIFIDI